MGAVLALFNRTGEPVEPQLVQAMLTASPDRAVNGSSIWLAGAVALGHQHFWVTPEEQGERQPLEEASGRCAITADLRLDNRPQLISALRLSSAAAASDAELVLAAYDRWGSDCVRRFLGDFVIVIWDAAERQLFIARDALGARGVSYYLDRDRLLVASEIKQLLAHPAVTPRLNEGKVGDYLSGIWHEHEETFYEGILYCPPAHCLLVKAEGVQRWQYWQLDLAARIRYRDDREYTEHLRQVLGDAVRCRLRCDGKIGISLSGGLDSGSVATLAAGQLANQGSSPLHAFTYVFEELAACDERRWVQPLVDHLGIDATFIVADGLWTLRDAASWPLDQDFVLHDSYARLPLATIEAAGRAGCRVLLTGHFGDIPFLGGDLWAGELMWERRLRQLLALLARHGTEIDWRRDLLRNGMAQLAPRWLRRLYRRLRRSSAPSLHPGLDPSFVNRAGLVDRAQRREHQQHHPCPGIDQRHARLSCASLPQGNAAVRSLHHRHGLEREDPFWDRRVVDLAMAFPADQLGRPGRSKWVLRNAMNPIMPQLNRERIGKTSFLPLFERGLRRERALVNSLLDQPQVVRRQLVRADWLQHVIGDQTAADRDDGHAFWLCLALELWLQRFWREENAGNMHSGNERRFDTLGRTA